MQIKNKYLTLSLIILTLVTFFSLVFALVLNHTKNDHENQFINGPFPDSNFPGNPKPDKKEKNLKNLKIPMKTTTNPKIIHPMFLL